MAGLILRVYQMIVPFLMRTIMIYVLGMKYVGLNSLFTSILQVLNLAELGVGSAMVYSMYKPIVEDNTVEICSLMKLFKLYYRIIGMVILFAGVIITPVIPNLISGDVPEGINIYILYLLNLGATVLSYWLFAYKNCLLTAHQRTDIVDKVTIVITTIQYGVQIVVLLWTKNYYAYIVIVLASQALLNISTAFVVDKMYPNYRPIGTVDKKIVKQINRRVKDLFTSKIGEVVVNSADTLIISAFLGLMALAIYNNYYFILTSVMGFVTIIFKACTAGIGNSLIVECEEKNYKDLTKFTFLISWIGCICSACFLCLYQPFMQLWVGAEYLLEFGCVICFSVYFYIRVVNQVLIVYKDASGMWHEDRFRPLCTALVNLGLNLATVKYMGVYGVLLSTVISTLFVGMPWVIKNLFTVVFHRSVKDYVFTLIKYATVTSFACGVTYLVTAQISINPVLTIISRLWVCMLIPNIIYILIFRKTENYKQIMLLIDTIVGKKVQILHKVIVFLSK